jgi:hypothetical protein
MHSSSGNISDFLGEQMCKLGLLMLLAVLTGCSNTISKKMAVEQIRKVYEDGDATILPNIGRVGEHCLYVPDRGEPWDDDRTPSKDAKVLAIQAVGYVTVTPDGPGFWKVDLTEKGKSLIHQRLVPDPPRKGCDYQVVSFLLGARDDIKVTNITGDENKATVEFTWRWKTTELGKAFRKDGKVYAALTPDQLRSFRHITLLSPPFPMPAPEDNDLIAGTATFAKDANGWHPE